MLSNFLGNNKEIDYGAVAIALLQLQSGKLDKWAACRELMTGRCKVAGSFTEHLCMLPLALKSDRGAGVGAASLEILSGNYG